MEIVLLGTGCPNVNPDRLGPAQLVLHGEQTLLIDCGSGVTQRMVAAGITGRDVDALLLAHLHSDHLVDLFQLISTSWQQGRDRPPRIFGPRGTRRFVEGLMEIWRPELEQRKAHEARSSIVALEPEVIEIEPGEILREEGLVVEAVEVDHRPVEPAFGFVVKAGGETVVFSGDTCYCPGLIAAAQGADLLVHEVFIHREFTQGPGRSKNTIANVAAYHTAAHQVGKVAAEANVRGLLLTHFVPSRFDREALFTEVRADFPGPLLIGEDLMRVDLTTGTVRHAGAVMSFGQGWFGKN